MNPVLHMARGVGVTRRLGKRLFSKLLYESFPAEFRGQLQLIEAVRKERALLTRLDEAYALVNAVRSAAKVPGDLAEVGVYQGASAKLICEMRAAGKALHLFDTFEGLPNPTDDDKGFVAGEYECSLDSVKAYLRAYRDVFFYKGYFPGTSAPVADRVFSFVNLDVDLYESTKGALDFFYPRISTGGILLSHDYNTQIGVKKAFDEFFADKPEPVIRLMGSQCMVVRTGSAA